jgi:glucuronokinase
MGPERGVAHARAALAGNPSDGYGGAVLGIALSEFAARAEARPASAPEVNPPLELVEATVSRFARELCPDAHHSAVRWSTSIPRSVGLGGSSAIVIATLRALCRLHAVQLTPAALADLALAVEREELGIAAGPQDRVAQSYGGLIYMDFAGTPRYEPLAPALMPPLLIAWRASTAEPSGPIHDELGDRFARGEPAVRRGIRELARAARAARDALLAGDVAEFRNAVDASFDTRRAMLVLDPRHVEMIELARGAGASANYAGSGGAIVCVCQNTDQRFAVADTLVGGGCAVASVEIQPSA